MAAPIADLAFPWDDADAPLPVAAIEAARAELGDTFEVRSGTDRYLFVFSDAGLAEFYGLTERDASKGLADYRMLLRKLPPELFDGRRTFAHDLFGAQLVEGYLDHLDVALDAEIGSLGPAGSFDAFALGRRLGHRLGLACWIGPGVATGDSFDELAALFDRLDGADAFVHPELVAAVVASGYAAERAALAAIESFVADLLAADRRDDGSAPDGFFGVIADRWSDVDEPARSQGVARDVVLLHVATLTNLVAAIGWTLVSVLRDPAARAAADVGDRAELDRVALDAIRRAQRSIMMRTALRPIVIDDGIAVHEVERGTIVATMVPVTNAVDGPWVTTFGHGPHRCPAKRFSLSAIARTVTRLVGAFEMSPEFDGVPTMVGHQIGGVGRPDGAARVDYRRR